jgi:hypothetical protein
MCGFCRRNSLSFGDRTTRENSGSILIRNRPRTSVARFRGLRRGLTDAGQMLGDPFVKCASLIGELDGAARAMNQSGPEAGLEFRDRFADAGLRHAQPFRGLTKAAGVGDGGEDHQAANQSVVNFVHHRCLSVIQEMTPQR